MLRLAQNVALHNSITATGRARKEFTMNTIKYIDLKHWYLENETAKENAEKYFGDFQPSLHQTGFYSAPSWNWGYLIGIVGVEGSGSNHDGNGIQSGVTKWFEVVTQFGAVKAAKELYLPTLRT